VSARKRVRVTVRASAVVRDPLLAVMSV